MRIGKFEQAIRNRRRQFDLSQGEVAQELGVTPAHVGHLENGRRRPSDEIVEQLARVLGFDRVDLLGLANHRRRVPRAQEADSAPNSAWRQFQDNESLLRIYKISRAEMEMLSYVALLGEFRSQRDIIHVLNMVRYAVGG